MRRLVNLLTAVSCWLLIATVAPAPLPAAEPANPQALVGSWKVDLRPTPDAEPYYQEFVVRSVEGGDLAATFYGTEVSEGSVNADWGRVHFAFVTEDGSGLYNTSGVLENGNLEGRTHALGRGFLSVWSAKRVADKPAGVPAEGPSGGIAESIFHPSAPAETSQFAFLLGNHRCSGQQMQRDGSYKPRAEAQWNGRVILGGWAIEDEWIAPLPDGRVSRGINIRSFNRASTKWDNRWLPTGTLEWSYFEAERIGETMVMTGGMGEDAQGAYVDRNIFSEAGPKGFKWRKDRSWDDGENWLQGVATIDCTTVKAAN